MITVDRLAQLELALQSALVSTAELAVASLREKLSVPKASVRDYAKPGQYPRLDTGQGRDNVISEREARFVAGNPTVSYGYRDGGGLGGTGAAHLSYLEWQRMYKGLVSSYEEDREMLQAHFIAVARSIFGR